ncbi:MAG TPA: 6-phosphogluconolactonase [Blastocatellia bacterium]|nr:6-phosphogluconolactonase [Blastocatellia bacterium]
MNRKAKTRVLLCAGPEELALTAAHEFVRLALDAIGSEGRFAVALSGGSTPKATFSLLAGPPFVSKIPWDRIYIFWSDERTVPPGHPDSNYRMANESLISRVPIPSGNVHRMLGENDPDKAAEAYSSELESFFGLGLPRFDLVMLGMGDEGHTASLFPYTEALKESRRSVVSNYVPKLATNRLTFSAPAINSARNVTFLIAGAAKASALKEVIEGAPNAGLYPSQLIDPQDGTLTWMLDRAAAARLDVVSTALKDGVSGAPVEIWV